METLYQQTVHFLVIPLSQYQFLPVVLLDLRSDYLVMVVSVFVAAAVVVVGFVQVVGESGQLQSFIG